MGVTCGQLDMRSFLNMFIPILVPLLFSPVSHPKIKKNFFFDVFVIASCSVGMNFQGNNSGHWIINHSVMHAVQRKDEEVEDTDISCYCTKEYFWCLLHLDHVVASIQDSTNWLSYMELALCVAKNATCIQVVITL